jgi:hypothetical protein
MREQDMPAACQARMFDTGYGNFLRTCIQDALDGLRFCDEEAAEALAEQVTNAEGKTESRDVNSLDFRLAVLRFFSGFHILSLAWENFSRQKFVDSNVRCPFCAARACSYEFLFESSESRLVISCPRCAEVVDIPLDAAVPSLSVSAFGMLALSAVPSHASAVVNILSKTESERINIEWPTDETGKLVSHLQLPMDALPDLPLVCRVLFSWDRQFGCISFKFRKIDGELHTPARPASGARAMRTI